MKSSARGSKEHAYDAVVVGSGPNGLAAAITLAQEGRSVLVMEGKATPGGGARSAELTLPGFIHDVCSAIHPLGAVSPFFNTLPLEKYGMRWTRSPAVVAHPLDDGTAVLMEHSVEGTAASLGEDGRAFRILMRLYARNWRGLTRQMLGPLRLPRLAVFPAYGLMGIPSLLPATVLGKMLFRGVRGRAFMAGMGGHSMMPLEWPGTGGLAFFSRFSGIQWGFRLLKAVRNNLPTRC